MLFFRRSRFVRLFLVPFTLTFFLSACQKWVPLEPPVTQALADAHPNPVRLTVADSEDKIEFSGWRVEADSIVGVTTRGRNASILVEDVQAVEARKTSAGKTALGTVGLVAIGVGVFFAYLAVFGI